MVQMVKLCIIVGARPQFIKASALLQTIRNKYADIITPVLIHSGQHYDLNMSEVFFQTLQLDNPDYFIESGSATHGVQTARMLEPIENILLKEKPHWCVVFGDTNTTLAGALAAAKLNIPLAHIEAGLRSYDKTMPEELNRIITDHCSTVLFAPTQTALINLRKEGYNTDTKPPFSINNPAIILSGDIMYEVYKNNIEQLNNSAAAGNNKWLYDRHWDILCTIHRQQNTDNEKNLCQILTALYALAEMSYSIIFPIHPRTRKVIAQSAVLQELMNKISHLDNIRICEPIDYISILNILRDVCIVLTDSGGLQKEAFFARKPCVILRNETEWIEIVQCGAAALSGVHTHDIIHLTQRMIHHPPQNFPELFGDGKTSGIICDWLISNTEKR